MLADALLVLARWLHFAALAVVFGGASFQLYAVPPGLRAAVAGRAASARAVKAAAWIALLSGLAWAAMSIIAIGGEARSLLDRDLLAVFFLDTSFGPVWMARLALLLALGLATARHGRDAARPALLAVLSGAALASMAWLGHVAMAQGLALTAETGSYAVHVLAAGAWIGGLVPLGLALGAPPAANPIPQALPAILARFSAAGMVAVALILASGVANAVIRLPAARDLVVTPYGWTILAKIALFAAMLSLAAANRWRLMPAVGSGDRGALTTLRRNVVAEQALGLLTLGAAALLGTLAP